MDSLVTYPWERPKPRHRPAGNARHYRNGRELSAPVALRIARYRNGPGFNPSYPDVQGREVTDTCHVTLEDAIFKTRWEFGVEEECDAPRGRKEVPWAA